MLQVKQKVRPNLVSLVKHFVDKCGFESHKIFLFGFSQGGEMAMDLAAFGGIPLGGVISIGGYLMDEVQNDPPALKKMPTQVLVLQGDKDDTRPVKVAKDKVKGRTIPTCLIFCCCCCCCGGEENISLT